MRTALSLPQMPRAQNRRSDFLPERWKILHGGLPQGGEIVSEYSNAWIDMRHDNAVNSAEAGGAA
jgi:hypothetical protein